MNAFFALPVPVGVIRELQNSRNDLKEKLKNLLPSAVTWQSESKWHVTLRYLRNLDEVSVFRMAEVVNELAQSITEPIELEVTAFGVWERRYIVARVRGPQWDRLRELHAAVLEKSSDIQPVATNEYAEFDPHITIAFVTNAGQEADSFDRIQTAVNELSASGGGRWRATMLALLESATQNFPLLSVSAFSPAAADHR